MQGHWRGGTVEESRACGEGLPVDEGCSRVEC
jgi:hypothetical protein